jgi:nucleoside-diphosphate-sugar epimerase
VSSSPSGCRTCATCARFTARRGAATCFCRAPTSGKAARLLGYRPTFDLRSGLAQTIDWYIKDLAPAQQASLAHV